MRKLMCKILSTVLIISALTACSSSNKDTYVAGTYTGTGSGFGGNVVATITVDGSKITDVVLEGANETPSIGGAALETLKEAVLKAQSAEVDAVTGATVTSNGVIEMVQLNQLVVMFQ